MMKTPSRLRQLRAWPLLAAAAAMPLVGCMTTYDQAGRPVQSVDPAVAVAGAAAAGLVGYAVAKDRDKHHHHHYHPRPGYYDRWGRPIYR